VDPASVRPITGVTRIKEDVVRRETKATTLCFLEVLANLFLCSVAIIKTWPPYSYSDLHVAHDFYFQYKLIGNLAMLINISLPLHMS